MIQSGRLRSTENQLSLLNVANGFFSMKMIKTLNKIKNKQKHLWCIYYGCHAGISFTFGPDMQSTAFDEFTLDLLDIFAFFFFFLQFGDNIRCLETTYWYTVHQQTHTFVIKLTRAFFYPFWTCSLWPCIHPLFINSVAFAQQVHKYC